MAQLGSSIVKEIEEIFGEEISSCFQCKKCSLGCPMSVSMEHPPHEIIRLLQYGLEERIYQSEALWICANCETCGARCPNGISVGGIIDSLRLIARERGLKTEIRDIPIFHKNYVESIKKRGRVHEVSMLMLYKLKMKNLFEDLLLGWGLFYRGKLPLKATSIKGKEELQKIFSKSNL